jgi:NAD(P)H-flavin reductase
MLATNIYTPQLTRIERIEQETLDTTTYFLSATEIPWRKDYKPGQFVELSAFGVGEAPFCLCQSPTRSDFIEVTIRKTGSLTNHLATYGMGDIVGLRGPFGNHFPFEAAKGKNLLFVGGGIGLPPLRSFINYALDHRSDYGDIYVLYGARTPSDRVYKKELAEWSKSKDLTLMQTVDKGDDTWTGPVGVVTELLRGMKIDPTKTVALSCGPPIMLRFVVAELRALKFADRDIITTLERYMKCGIGKCGHCCVGQHYICVDGPVYNYEDISYLPEVP